MAKSKTAEVLPSEADEVSEAAGVAEIDFGSEPEAEGDEQGEAIEPYTDSDNDGTDDDAGPSVDEETMPETATTSEAPAPAPATAPEPIYWMIRDTNGYEVVKFPNFDKAVRHATKRAKVGVGLEIIGVYRVVSTPAGWMPFEA